MDKIIYSKTNDPTQLANEDYDVIKFATPEDAKKAERMFEAMRNELVRMQPDPAAVEKARRILTAVGDSGRDIAHDAYADEVAAELVRISGDEPQSSPSK